MTAVPCPGRPGADCAEPRCIHHGLAPWYTPHEKQRPVHRDRHRYRNIVAGRRGGKTTCAAVEFRRSILRDQAAGLGRVNTAADLPIWERAPALHYWIVAPQSSLYKPAWRNFLRVLTEQERMFTADGVLAGRRRSPSPAVWLPGDVLIECKTAEHPETLVGEGLDGVWLTEAARLDEEVWEMNLRPALADRGGWVLCDTTPVGRNWFYDEFWRRGLEGDAKRDHDYANFAWHTRDNTAVPLVVREAEAARLRAQKTGGALLAIYKREFEASFDAFIGQIFMLDPAVHVFTGPVHPSRYTEIIGGFDWARAHAGCLLMVGVRDDGGYDVVAETYEAGLLAASWITKTREAVAYWDPEAIYSDPSSPILPDMQNAGLPIQPAVERGVLAGIERIADLLSRSGHRGPLLRVHANCTNLIREMQGYRWKEGGGDVPVKQDDDACDALRYGLGSHARGPGLWTIR